MTEFAEMSKGELEQAKEAADKDYEELKSRNLNLDMSRGKPAPSQIETRRRSGRDSGNEGTFQ